MRECLSHNVTVIEKSRRIGISWVLSWLAVTVAMSSASAGGMDVFYMGYEKDMTRQFIDDCAEHAKLLVGVGLEVGEEVFPDPANPEKTIHVFRIKFASGFEILALPSVPRAFRSKQGLVILDEAAFVDDLAGMIKAALALRIWGARIIILSTHKGATNPFNELVKDCQSGKKPYHLMRITFDDAVSQGLYRKICQKLGTEWTPEGEKEWYDEILAEFGDDADEELHVIPANDNGVFLPLSLIEAREQKGVPVVRWERKPAFALQSKAAREADARQFCEDRLLPHLMAMKADTPHVFGEDFARTCDLSVFWFCAIESNKTKRTVLVVELRGVPFEQQRQILFYLLDRLPRFRAGKMDARGNGQYLAEVTVQEYGSRVEAVMISEAWYRETMPFLQAAFQDAEIVIPADRDIQTDLRAIKTIRGVARVPESRLTDATGKSHGDAAIAAAMAVAASRAEPEIYEYQRVPNQHAQLQGGRMSIEDEIEREDLGSNNDNWGLRGSV
ncbi:hypothetical protein HLH48_07915 [Gluconacetobacter sacchari]|uniref:Mu-like prophage FluMu protein gp28 n=1 Tax=Gluconacetobacter sacchari TaxID=92759 RepID=A0A7W4ICB3_9PROT|nr:hypothetical protein [Gluconacetobacter sacchari]